MELLPCWTMCFALRPGVFTMKRDISPPRPFINFYGERVRAGRGIPNSSRWSELTQFLTEELGEERRGREELGEEKAWRRRVIRALGNTDPLKPFSRKVFSCLDLSILFNNCTRSNRKDHNSNYRQILLQYEQIGTMVPGTRWRRLHYLPICPPGGVIRVLALLHIMALAFLPWVERTRSWSRSGK